MASALLKAHPSRRAPIPSGDDLPVDRDAWKSHKWLSAQGRPIEIEPGKPVIQRRCSRCRREFIEDPSSAERCAVYVSVFSFRKLPEPISKQWLAELCPGAPLPCDVEMRCRLIEHRVR
jgi:hypothetical protein